MIDQLIIVDYQEGAGGEFFASFLGAHLGHDLVDNPQNQPNHLQKWLNSHSLAYSDWDRNFDQYFDNWIKLVDQPGPCGIAAPYHLYKYPHHIEKIKTQWPQTRFVRINAQGYEYLLQKDFERKVSNRPLSDFEELSFLIRSWSHEKKLEIINKFKNKKLLYSDLFQSNNTLKILPSRDLEIHYRDWFVPGDKIFDAYGNLCNDLKINQNTILLDKLIQRNNKNWQSLQEKSTNS